MSVHGLPTSTGVTRSPESGSPEPTTRSVPYGEGLGQIQRQVELAGLERDTDAATCR